MAYVEPDFLPWDGRRVPITFVGGYLGAGKTTAINEVLSASDRPIAVIVNDAGAVNVDARLVRRRHGDTIELTDGCVCCTSIDDIGAAFDTIRARTEPPDHVVVELSGIAEPRNVIPWGTSAGFLLDGVVVVAAVDQLLDDGLPHWIRLHLEAQIRVADLLILTKTDLADDDAVATATRLLQDWAPGAPVVDGGLGGREPGALGRFLGIGGHRGDDAAGVPGPTLFDLHATHTVPVTAPMSHDELTALTAGLADRFPDERIARAKGVVELDSGELVLVQVVGPRTEITPLFDGERQPPTDLVVITVPSARPGSDPA